MANKKKWINPVRVEIQVEEATNTKIEKLTNNKTDWINEAIKEKLERDNK